MKTPALLLTLPGFTALLASQSLKAQTWDGGGVPGGVLTWSTAANWNPDGVPANTGAANIIMAGTIDNNPGPDLNANWDINSLTFTNTAGPFVLQSTGAFALTVGNITNNDTETQTVSHALQVKPGAVWSAASGVLSFSGAVNNSGNLLTISGAQSSNFTGVISGIGGLTKNGTGSLFLQGAAANTYSGVTLLNTGGIGLGKTAGVAAIAGDLIIGDGAGTDTVSVNANEQIANTSAVAINNGGVFSLNGAIETVGPLVINSGGTVQTNATGQLTVTTLDVDGATITGASTGFLRIGGSVTSGVAAATVITVPTFNLGGSTQTFSIADSAAASDLDIGSVVTNGGITKAGAGTLRLTGANNYAGGFTLGAGTVAVGSNTALGTGTFNFIGGTVTADGAARQLTVSTVLNGTAVACVGANELRLTGSTTFSATTPISVTGSGAFNLAGVVGGAAGAGITKTGPGTLTLSGASNNTFPGTVTVNEGSVTLAKTGTANALNGIINVGDGTGTDILNISGPGTDQIGSGGQITINAGGQMNVLSDETVGKTTVLGLVDIASGEVLTVTGTALAMTGGTIQGGTLSAVAGLNTNLSTTTSLISSAVDLAAGARIFNVAPGVAIPDLEISGVVSNGSLIKTGTGSLLLSNANTFSGFTSSNGFTILSNNTSAGIGTITLNGGSIEAATAPLTFSNALTLGGTSQISGTHVLIFTGPVTVAADSELQVGDTAEPATLTLSGAIGDGGTPRTLTKSGLRTLLLNGANANTYTGLTDVEAGTLELNKTAPNGAIPGPLTIGDGIGPALNDNVRLLASDQIADASAITLSSTIGFSARLDLNGFNDTVGSLIFNGGLVQTGTGTLRIGAGVFRSTAGGVVEMSGRFDLNGGTVFQIEDSPNSTDLMIFGPLSNGPLIKNGAGSMFIAGSAVSPVSYTLNAGELQATMTVQPGFTLTQNGGTFAGALNNAGTFIYNGGTFTAALTNSGQITLNAPFTAAAGLTNDGAITVTAASSLTADGTGLVNNGTVTLQGGTLNGSGPLENNSLLTGYGILAGSGGFTNNALLTQTGGNLRLSNSGTNTSTGNIDLEAGRQFILQTSLQNAGTLDLDGGIVTGAGTLNNTGSVTGRGSIFSAFNNAGGQIANTAGTLNISSAFTNTGTLALDGLSAALNGGAITNNGTIQGRGSIGSDISNFQTIEASGGTLTLGGTVSNSGLLAAGTGAKLLITGTLPDNNGTISLTGGTFDTGGDPLNNGGNITGYGILRTGGLTNDDTITLTGGLSTVNGNVQNIPGSTIHVAHNPAIFTGAFVNNGIFKNTETTVTFTGTYTENGTFVSDPADNYFTDLLIGPNGKLTGGIGDRFFVLEDFTNGSAQSAAWQTHDSDLIFDGGPAHTFALAGADTGTSAAGFTANFAWKTVRLAAGQSLTLADGNAAPGAALYTRAFLLDGGLAQISSINGNGFTIYYDPADPLSAPLAGQTYPLTAGGFLKPVTGAALTITASNFQPDGSLKIDVLGVPNALHNIEASPDLVTFTLIGTATADGSGIFSFIDTDADVLRRRCYRVVKP